MHYSKMENSLSKRKDVHNMDCDSVTLKKARYSWQIKKSTKEDLSSVTDVVICDNVSTCQHCNSGGSNSICDCNLRKVPCADVGKQDMECSVNTKNEQLTLNSSSSEPSIINKNENTNSSQFQTPMTPLSSVQEGCGSIYNLSRTSSPVSSNFNFSFDGQDSDLPKEDGRISVMSGFSDATSLLAQPSSSSVDPEIEEEGLLISNRQREEELNLYLKRWQNQHIAKSIVDNAINKTLEEMGVSPEPQQFVTNLVENHAISEAIKLQGLIPQTSCSNPVTVLSDLAHSSSYFLSSHNRSDHSTTNNARQSNSSNDLLDHAVSVAIGSKGLSFTNPGQGT